MYNSVHARCKCNVAGIEARAKHEHVLMLITVGQ